MHTLHALDLSVNVKIGDGTQGWEDEGLFDRILVSAASPQINEKLYDQLAVGGILLLPVGGSLGQELVSIRKKSVSDRQIEHLSGCIFVPLIGKYGFLEKDRR
jgi:protein-L-isoaspartate(D-aspartate) O-methyltransferase